MSLPNRQTILALGMFLNDVILREEEIAEARSRESRLPLLTKLLGKNEKFL